MAKELVVTIRFPLSDVPTAAEKVAIADIKKLAKKMFPKDKLPLGSAIDFKIKDKK